MPIQMLSSKKRQNSIQKRQFKKYDLSQKLKSVTKIQLNIKKENESLTQMHYVIAW